jgi:hypothetical protein
MMSDRITDFIALMNNPVKFRFFLLTKLPSAFFAGVRISTIDKKRAVVTVPYKWFSQNPFRSTYFACLAMAAEMSTGSLAMAYLYKRQPAVSMLVVGLEAQYYKKAIARTFFSCEDGELFEKAIASTIATGEPQTVQATSTGTNEKGEAIATFFITWSFKRRDEFKQAL